MDETVNAEETCLTVLMKIGQNDPVLEFFLLNLKVCCIFLVYSMSEGDSVGDSVHGKPSVVYRFFTRLGQVGFQVTECGNISMRLDPGTFPWGVSVLADPAGWAAPPWVSRSPSSPSQKLFPLP